MRSAVSWPIESGWPASTVRLALVGVGLTLAACSATGTEPTRTANETAATETPPGTDPAMASSRLLGLGVGVPLAEAVARLRTLEGAVLIQRIQPSPELLVVTASRVGVAEPSRLILASLEAADPHVAGDLVASLADAPATTQVRISSCGGRVWRIAVAHDPGAPIDARDDWARRFPADRLVFPEGWPSSREGERTGPGGRRWTATRHYPSPAGAAGLLTESLRMFEAEGAEARSQLLSGSIEDQALCRAPSSAGS